MSRLIDVDNFKVFLHNLQDAGAEHVSFENLHKFLDEEPTAYDVDKVVERLEEKAELARKKCTIYPVYNPLYDRYDTQYQELKACLEIVKGGGVNG